ncbi:MAG: catalase [Clostridia bacterium]|nr:catalase [Clostridia bacterium]
MSIKSAFNHFKTITRHRHAVIAHCKKAGILWQGLFHDLSKYAPVEFSAGIKYYTGTRSPNDGERKDKGYSAAWMHHKGRNKHHFEYWTDYNPQTRVMSPVKMPARYVAEMFCDRVAASKIYQGKNYTNRHPLEYFLGGKAVRIIHPETSDLLEDLLVTLANEGEEEAFKKVRQMVEQDNY